MRAREAEEAIAEALTSATERASAGPLADSTFVGFRRSRPIYAHKRAEKKRATRRHDHLFLHRVVTTLFSRLRVLVRKFTTVSR